MVKKRKIRAAYGVIYRERWSPEKHERGEFAKFAKDYKYTSNHSPDCGGSGKLIVFIESGIDSSRDGCVAVVCGGMSRRQVAPNLGGFSRH